MSLMVLFTTPICSDDSIIVQVQDTTNDGAGFDVTAPGLHDFTITLQAIGTGNEIVWSSAYDNLGTIIWDPGFIGTQAFQHSYTAFGLTANDVHTGQFDGGLLQGGDPTMMMGGWFTVTTSHLDLDASDNDPYMCQMTGGPCADDDDEAITGVGVPITRPGTTTLPDTLPSTETGHPLWLKLSNNGQPGMLTITVTGSGAAVYQFDSTANEYTKVTAPIPVDEFGFAGTLELHTNDNFTADVTIEARFDHDNGLTDAADLVKVFYVADRVDLQLAGLPNTAEEDPGAFLGVGAQQPATLVLEGDGITGTWMLSIPGNISVEQDNGDGTFTEIISDMPSAQVTLPQTIDLRVTGLSPSVTVRDTDLRATFTEDGSGTTDDDLVVLTVMDVRLTIHNGGSDLDIGQSLGTPGGSVAAEDADNPGAFILVNWDDDDADGYVNDDGDLITEFIPDMEENPVVDEDNLAQLEIHVSPLIDAGVLTLTLTGTGIQLWDSPTKENPFGPMQWDLANSAERAALQTIIGGGKLWYEATTVSDQPRDISFVLSYKPKDFGFTPVPGPILSATVRGTKITINLGNAVYRDNQLWYYLGGMPRGHSAIVRDFLGPMTLAGLRDDKNFSIVEMPGPSVSTLDKITASTEPFISPAQKRGCYTVPNLTKRQRLHVLGNIEAILKRSVILGGLAYAGFGSDVLLPKKWNGKISSIVGLRCDGIVEVCYEKAALDVWGKERPAIAANPLIGAPARPQGWKYNIADQLDIVTFFGVTNTYLNAPNAFNVDYKDNLEEHNDYDFLNGVPGVVRPWQDTLMPATQGGWYAQTGTFKTDTKFEKQDLCLPQVLQLSTGGN